MCDHWLSKHRPPNHSNSTILFHEKNIFDNDKFRNATEYTLIIKTSKHALIPDPSLNVQFQMVGSKGQSQVFTLSTLYEVGLFEKNQLDAFLVMSSIDLGKPEKLRMAHNLRKLPHDWIVEEIKVIYSRDPNKFYLFKLDKWLDKNQKMNALINFDSVATIDSTDDSEPGMNILTNLKYY